MEEITKSVYTDWTFWSFAVAGLALLLSQLPPIKSWFRGGRLRIDIFAKMHITHRIGNPNAQVHILLTNAGNRAVQVKAISLEFVRDGGMRFEIPAINYLTTPSDNSPTLLTAFTIQPQSDWGHLVNFIGALTREQEREYKQLEGPLRAELIRLRALPENTDRLVTVDPQFYQQFLPIFNARFVWLPGEYQVRLKVNAYPESASKEATFRVTIFESDSAELRGYTNDYNSGAGISWHSKTHVGVLLNVNAT